MQNLQWIVLPQYGIFSVNLSQYLCVSYSCASLVLLMKNVKLEDEFEFLLCITFQLLNLELCSVLLRGSLELLAKENQPRIPSRQLVRGL
jgi:hypothetical protein